LFIFTNLLYLFIFATSSGNTDEYHPRHLGFKTLFTCADFKKQVLKDWH